MTLDLSPEDIKTIKSGLLSAIGAAEYTIKLKQVAPSRVTERGMTVETFKEKMEAVLDEINRQTSETI